MLFRSPNNTVFELLTPKDPFDEIQITLSVASKEVISQGLKDIKVIELKGSEKDKILKELKSYPGFRVTSYADKNAFSTYSDHIWHMVNGYKSVYADKRVWIGRGWNYGIDEESFSNLLIEGGASGFQRVTKDSVTDSKLVIPAPFVNRTLFITLFESENKISKLLIVKSADKEEPKPVAKPIATSVAKPVAKPVIIEKSDLYDVTKLKATEVYNATYKNVGIKDNKFTLEDPLMKINSNEVEYKSFYHLSRSEERRVW